jgi:hypothetical protein
MSPSDFPTAHAATAFKTCTHCEERWGNLDAFIQDPTIELVGYMPTFDDLLNGLILFNHSCGTTLACRVALFEHLYDGPVYQTRKTGEAECPGYCQDKTNFSPCPNKCSCAFVRETLQIIKQWSKTEAP